MFHDRLLSTPRAAERASRRKPAPAATEGAEPPAPKEMVIDFFESAHSNASNALLNIQKQLLQYQGQVSEAEVREFMGQTFSSAVTQSQEEFCAEYAIALQVCLATLCGFIVGRSCSSTIAHGCLRHPGFHGTTAAAARCAQDLESSTEHHKDDPDVAKAVKLLQRLYAANTGQALSPPPDISEAAFCKVLLEFFDVTDAVMTDIVNQMKAAGQIIELRTIRDSSATAVTAALVMLRSCQHVAAAAITLAES
eukprot:10554-Heterococcus_DN1.PRE.3